MPSLALYSHYCDQKRYVKFREEGMNHARMIMNGLYGPM